MPGHFTPHIYTARRVADLLDLRVGVSIVGYLELAKG